MMKANKGKTLMMMAVLALSLAFSGFAHAAALKTMKSDSGMELFHLRQASEMYGYSIEWNEMDRSVTLVYMDKMDDSMMGDDTMMKDDKMMDDSSMMKDDKMMGDGSMMKDDKMMDDGSMMKDDKMMDDGSMMKDDGSMMKDDKMMVPAGKMIKLWIDSKEIMIDGMKVTLDTAPMIFDGSTYVVETLITKYMKPAMPMN